MTAPKPVRAMSVQQIRELSQKTTWNPEHMETIVAMGSEGRSKAQICAALQISRPTFDLWIKQVPECREAWNFAYTLSQAWHEDRAHDSIMDGDKKFNSDLWRFVVQNRYKHDYATKSEVTLAVSGDLLEILAEIEDGGSSLKKTLAARAAEQSVLEVE